MVLCWHKPNKLMEANCRLNGMKFSYDTNFWNYNYHNYWVNPLMSVAWRNFCRETLHFYYHYAFKIRKNCFDSMAARWKILMSHICDTGQMSSFNFITHYSRKLKNICFIACHHIWLFYKLIFNNLWLKTSYSVIYLSHYIGQVVYFDFCTFALMK